MKEICMFIGIMVTALSVKPDNIFTDRMILLALWAI